MLTGVNRSFVQGLRIHGVHMEQGSPDALHENNTPLFIHAKNIYSQLRDRVQDLTPTGLGHRRAWGSEV